MFYNQNPKVAALYILISGLMFAFMGACIKYISDDVSTELIVFFRNLFAFLIMLPFAIKTGLKSLSTNVFGWHLVRSFAGVGAMYCFFYSIAYIPLSESVLLSYTTPLFAPVIAYFLLKERVSQRFIFAIILGFMGVSILLNPDFESFSWVSLIALCAGMLAAIAMTSIRKLSKTEPAILVVFYFGLISTIVSALLLFLSFTDNEKLPTLKHFFVLLAIGLFAALGQFCLTRGYSMAKVAQVGPYVYSTVVFATLIGWVYWHEVPTVYTGLGIILVIIAGVFALRTLSDEQKY